MSQSGREDGKGKVRGIEELVRGERRTAMSRIRGQLGSTSRRDLFIVLC